MECVQNGSNTCEIFYENSLTQKFTGLRYLFVHYINIAIKERVQTIHEHLAEITTLLNNVKDSGALDRTISLLSQASAVLRTVEETEASSQPISFKTTTYFAPAKKNETQLQFKRSTRKPGRKKAKLSL